MAKWLSGETLQMLKKEEKAKGERERYTQPNAEYQTLLYKQFSRKKGIDEGVIQGEIKGGERC